MTVQVAPESGLSYADMFEPPSGERFLCGVILTHDLSAALMNEVAPRLGSITSSDIARRRMETRSVFSEGLDAPDDGWLLVLACADRVDALPAFPGIHIETISGRRFHAKCALLVFFDPSRPDQASTVRAVITSANVTDGGLFRNREVILYDETTSPRNPSPIVSEVASIVRQLRGTSTMRRLGIDQKAASIAAFVSDWASPLTAKPSRATGFRLHESITATTPLVSRSHPPVTRLIVVSPAFARSGDTVVDQIEHLLDRSSQVDLYIGAPLLASGDRVEPPVFSPRILQRLRSLADPDRVRLHLVPELEQNSSGIPRTRMLHAKLIALLDGSDTATVYVGSANFTASGLGGQNRELMAETQIPTHEVLRFIDQLDAHRYVGETLEPVSGDANTRVPDRPRLQANFSINADQSPTSSVWTGTLSLRLTGASNRPQWVVVNGQRYAAKSELLVTISEADCTIVIEWPDGTATRQLVTLSAPDGFWDCIGSPDPDVDVNREFVNALFDLRRAGSRPRSEVPTPSTGSPQSGNDGFRIPLQQRLVVLTRLRHLLLADLGPEELLSRLADYIGDPIEHRVARTVLLSHFDPTFTDSDPLLAEFAKELRKVAPL